MSRSTIAITIIEDTKEQKPLDFSACPLCNVVHKALGESRGDYSVLGYEDQFAIERKSLADLVGTVLGVLKGEERFVREMQMLSTYRFAAVVVEDLEVNLRAGKYRSTVNPASIIGKIRALEVRYRIPFYFAGNRIMAARLIYEFAYYFAREMASDVPPAPKAYRLPPLPKPRKARKRKAKAKAKADE